MKSLFILLVGILIIMMIGWIIVAINENNRFSEPVTNIIFAAISMMFFYTINLLCYEPIVGLLLKGTYYASLDWLFVFIIRYVHAYTETNTEQPSYRFMQFIFYGLAMLDSTFMLFNAFFQYAFTITPQYDVLGEFLCWGAQYKSLFYIHTAICYSMILYICIVLVRRMVKLSRIYRRKYIIILSVFLFTCFLNVFRVIFSWKLDYSIFSYTAMAMIICYLTFLVFPREIEAGMHYMVAEQINGAVICYDLNGRCIYISKLGKELFSDTEAGRKQAEEYREKWIEKETDWQTWEDCLTLGEKENIYAVEYTCLRDKHNKMEGSYLKFQNRTREITQFEKEKYKATHDMLTGLYNRVTFFEKAEELIRNKPNVPRYLVATNIKDFKLINDLFGSEFGDKVIKEQARMLQLADYEDCIKGRIAADKFAMLINKEDFNPKLAEKNTAQIQNVAWEINHKLHLYLGVYEVKNAWEKVQSMYDKANVAIDNIKSKYDRQLIFYDATMMEQVFKEKYIVGEFPKALEQKKFQTLLVPQVNEKNETIGYYMTVKWLHSVLGEIFPEQFMSILEKAGYSYLYDSYLWEEAAKQLYAWKMKGKADNCLSMEISPKTFYYVDVCEKLEKLVEKYQLDASQFYLEVSETAFRHETRMHLDMIEKLQKKGFKIVINNFGNGFSTLNLLKDISVDRLKLGKEFLKETEDEERSRIILQMIITMATKLGINVIADGVENEAQREFLISMGCMGFQGKSCEK